MLAAALLVLSLAVAVLAYRSARSTTPRRVRTALGILGAALLVEHLLVELARAPAPGAARATALLVRAAVGVALWGATAWLAACGERTRGKWVRGSFAALALLVAFARGPWTAIGILMIPAVWSYGWRSALDTRQLFATAVGGLVVLAAGLVHGAHAPQTELRGALATLDQYGRWVTLLGNAYVALGVLKALAAFVRDPSLGIRTIRRRLALSHALVVFVPLAITAAMWVLTTWLGVGSDRALQGKRAIEHEAAELRGALAQALATPGDPRAALAAIATSRADAWPGARVWAIGPDGARQVAGTPGADGAESAALAAWAAAPESLATRGIVQIGRVRWLAALARSRGGAAAALVPLGPAVASGPEKAVGARLWVRDTLPASRADTVALAAVDSAFPHASTADSARLARARAAVRSIGLPDTLVRAARPRERPAKLHVVAGTDTLDVDDDDSPANGPAGITGMAIVPGLRWTGRAWKEDGVPLTARVALWGALAGLFRSTRENQLNIIPIAVLAGLVLLLLPVAIFNFGLVRALGRSVLQPVAALREGTRALAESRTEHRITVAGEDELWQAADAFNRMADGLARARELEKERDRLEHELDVARRIQQRLLPAGPPHVPGLEVAGVSEPAREVGGDYYDHIPVGDGRVLLVIADVSGKGVPAALLMSAFRASLMSQDTVNSGPDVVTERLNDFLHRSVDPGKFVTAFVGFLDGATGRFVYANAGHNPPLLLRADGTVEWLATGGLILGILPDSRFESGETRLEPGDVLALYTDGVTEGAQSDGEQYGEDRMVESVRRRAALPCRELAEAVVREVRAFEGETGPADDITMLVARRTQA